MKNFIMEIPKEKRNKIIFITVFFIVNFIAEFFYSDYFFDNSVSIAKTLQNNLSFSITFFKYFTYLGVIEYLWMFLIFLLFFPITYCYSIFIVIIISIHVCNYFKLLYGQGRPFLLDASIRIACEGDYGNPSGHSLLSTTAYFSLAQILIDKYEIRKIQSIILYSVLTIIILLINFSRVILAVHSINQVIYGDVIGFTIYFIVFQIIKPHLRDPKEFFERFLNKKYILINVGCFSFVLLYIILGAIICDRKGTDKYKYLKKQLKLQCNLEENSILTNSGVNKSLIIFACFGMVIGMFSLAYIIKVDYYSRYKDANNYYKKSNQKWYLRYGIKFIFLVICFLPLYATIVVPNNINMIFIYIVGSSIPSLIFGFLLFGAYFNFNIASKRSNLELYIPEIGKNENENENEYKLTAEEEV